MEPGVALDITREALIVMLRVLAPLLLVALVVGSLVSLLQALTQIQEPTLTFMPKLIAVIFTIFLMMHYIGGIMASFFEHIASLIVSGG